MFGLFQIMFPLVFILVFGIIIVTIIRGVGEWSSNNKQPILNVDAKVVSKRTNVSRGNHHHGIMCILPLVLLIMQPLKYKAGIGWS